MKQKVLFLCTGNSCRSQMAEGWARQLHGDRFDAHSAGVQPHGMNARTVEVMREVGVDLLTHRSKHVDELSGIIFDWVVTVCDQANETCPVFPGKTQRMHVGFDDPPKLAEGARSEEEALAHYRIVRDEIREFIEQLPEALERDATMSGGVMTRELEKTMKDKLTNAIQSNYAAVARAGLSSDNAGVRAIAEAFGYSEGELRSIPAEANMGLSCGNPTAFASLKKGEVVVDLGCGGGLDVLLAANQVGPSGKAIGVDMTADMITLAKKNAAKWADGVPAQNVEFHHASIDQLPLSDDLVDCVISNCVINLASDKRKVFAEMFRVLKPGGRVAVSDIALKRALPTDLEQDIAAYVGCISGAISIQEFRDGLSGAGFGAVDVIDSGTDLNAYTNVQGQSACCSPAMASSSTGLPIAPTSSCGSPVSPVHEGLSRVLERYNLNDYAASVKVYAIKQK